MRKIWLFSSA
ncbi:hypothetical protein CP8484711_2034, partial [Chlamydia psittaci 84-8471/1]